MTLRTSKCRIMGQLPFLISSSGLALMFTRHSMLDCPEQIQTSPENTLRIGTRFLPCTVIW